ncbi:Putative SWI/SNF-related matrix-associated actin-dependent regulator of chromatin subfamily A member 3-like 1 [Fusarium oxysporum f. sp. cubense race 1]|uniref:Putative SWI/SNF-related matrix-associated actin-dependent regulator of chromatin subfamily A member 3-like 1 n=1 Tax=Fusarium oxysporum f. sp. cubense (strain race 1) TaxID=1229664 RepID=N4UC20_FUSC1|nr:Putative SWI/SNF-related matrix-associated actin-dependent regulator of chromatin subfamily A member 3-like 1 [Fusarium oxysporum f. sp. cubense race 1]
MSNVRDLLNPVDDDKHDMSHSLGDWLGVEQDQDLYMGDASSAQGLSINGSVDETSQAFYFANTLVDPLFPEHGVSEHHYTQNNALDVDPQLGMMNFDIDFDMNDIQMTPHPDEEQNVASGMSTTLGSFQFLQLPTESSREGSAMTPELSVPSRSNATPITLPEDDDVIVHYGMLHNIEVKLVPDDMSSIDERLAAEASAYQYFTSKEYQKQLMLCFPGDEMHFVDINIYGLRSKALDIGKRLSNGKLWLQRSSHGRHGFAYENPHFLNISIQDTGAGEVQDMQPALSDGVPKKMSKEDQLRKMVDEVYKTVENSRELEMVEGGDKVTRQLLRHQKEALGFMLERESGHINEKYRLWEEIEHENGKFQYRHRITKRRKDIRPEERGGGILADEMGMGKSLSILALIMKTLDNGQQWAEDRNAEHKSRRSLKFSRSTLVVVSAALLVDEWMNEVKKHLQRGLRVVRYHGENRPKTLEELSVIKDSDIVVTTYHTLTAEYLIGKGKASPLYKLGWYRIVLDEAHIIRRPSTKFFQACEYLHANSRWCLSGTPIQNKLADIGSLFRFIRAEPFDKASEFRKWIETPFGNSFEDPELHRMGEVKKSSQFGMFQMWLQLRIVCNHGTYQKLFSWHRRSLLEEREAIVGAAGQYGEISCVGLPRDEQTIAAGERPRKRRKATASKDDHESYFNEQGFSTKIRTLVEDVQKDLWTTKRHLEQAKIPYLQLDGNIPLPQRQATLLKFENEGETPVLIMTTGTGAFGLNLTCANRIFIAELQWNPSVESQAISRAIRLGQESEVRVTRYITRNTVEEQQEYKKQIAALGFEEEIY